MGFEANRPVETTIRTFDIIERLRETGGSGITELAESTGVSKGIVHNHVSTLRQLGYVIKVEDRYELSAEVFRLGQGVREAFPVYQHGSEAVDALAIERETRATLIGRAGDEGVVLDDVGTAYAEGPEYALGDVLRAEDDPLAVLLSESDIKLDVPTGCSVRDVGDDTTERRILVANHTGADRFTGVVAPLHDADGSPVGTIACHVSGEHGAEPADEAIKTTVDAAERVEARLTSEWETDRTFATVKHTWVR